MSILQLTGVPSGAYRDPVRSSHGHFVKASGLRWLSFMVLIPVPWTRLIKAFPVLTLLACSATIKVRSLIQIVALQLAPSERSNRQRGCRHKLLTDWAVSLAAMSSDHLHR